MIGGISSSVRRARDGYVPMLHLLGGAAGGAVVATGAWIAATPLRTLLPGFLVAAVMVMVAIRSVAADLNWTEHRWGWGKQVPATWLARWGRGRAFAAYGFVLGGGLTSFAPFAVTYVVFSASGLLLALGPAAVAGALFGGARSTLVVTGLLRPAGVADAIFVSGRLRNVFRYTSVTASLLVAAAALSATAV
jgi:hypothetical protein